LVPTARGFESFNPWYHLLEGLNRLILGTNCSRAWTVWSLVPTARRLEPSDPWYHPLNALNPCLKSNGIQAKAQKNPL